MTIALMFTMLLSPAQSAFAQEDRVASGRDAHVAPSQAPGPTDPAEMGVFLDGLFAQEMEEYHIAGAAVSVVKDGKLFFTKGYGYANIEKGNPVDPEQTLFRIGSATKTFTCIAMRSRLLILSVRPLAVPDRFTSCWQLVCLHWLQLSASGN
jgi:CubicO group peptidase (beta-lactamase class C family)